jgi:hypothetical protein
MHPSEKADTPDQCIHGAVGPNTGAMQGSVVPTMHSSAS